MTTTVSAYAATSATEPLIKTTIQRRDPGPHDVAFDIHFAGICHSDIHTVKGEWGQANYPLAPGHEIAGIVTAVGSEVTAFKVGDRVGVGCFVDSCRECTSCLAGEENYCKRGMTGTYNAVGRDGEVTQGGYSGAIVAKVTVLSQSLKKMEDGLRLGATEYYATSDPETFTKLEGSFDLILNTVSANLDLDAYMSLLDVDGTLVELGMPEHPMELAPGPLVSMRRSLSGSMIGGIPETQEMLDFCAEYDVRPEIEVIQPDYINEAYERVLASDVRYRFVIDTASLR